MRGESEVTEDKWLFEVALIGRLEHTGVRQVVETQAVQMSLNERQWRTFKDKNDVSWLYDGPHGDELGVMKMARMCAGRRMHSVAEFGSRSRENLVSLTHFLKSIRRHLRDLIPRLYIR